GGTAGLALASARDMSMLPFVAGRLVRKGGLEPRRPMLGRPGRSRAAARGEGSGQLGGKAGGTAGLALASARDMSMLPFVAGRLVRKGGLEPPRLAALEPKSRASTNSATFAPVAS